MINSMALNSNRLKKIENDLDVYTKLKIENSRFASKTATTPHSTTMEKIKHFFAVIASLIFGTASPNKHQSQKETLKSDSDDYGLGHLTRHDASKNALFEVKTDPAEVIASPSSVTASPNKHQSQNETLESDSDDLGLGHVTSDDDSNNHLFGIGTDSDDD